MKNNIISNRKGAFAFLAAIWILATFSGCKVDGQGEDYSSQDTAPGVTFYTSSEEEASSESSAKPENSSEESSSEESSSEENSSEESSSEENSSQSETTAKKSTQATQTTQGSTAPPATKPPAQTTPVAGDNATSAEQEQINEVVRLVNIEREAQGISPLSADNVSLMNAAQERANEVGSHFSHTRPSGANWDTVLSEYDISPSTWGENIAKGHKDAAMVVEGWMLSAGHRENILNPRYTHIGVGYDSLSKAWVQLFAG